jgi:2-polyprenyl-3-methyl-5-hydroxy-6-metoxy-1,4-benzoquinol methylase
MTKVPYVDPESRVDDQITDLGTDQADAEDWSQLAGSDWEDAESLHRHLSQQTNFVKAVQTIPSDRLLPDSAVVLDLGCGSGWLAGLLTRRPGVK